MMNAGKALIASDRFATWNPQGNSVSLASKPVLVILANPRLQPRLRARTHAAAPGRHRKQSLSCRSPRQSKRPLRGSSTHVRDAIGHDGLRDATWNRLVKMLNARP